VQKIDNLVIEPGETIFLHQEVKETKKNVGGVLIVSNYRVINKYAFSVYFFID
jgi:hypothetical protein